VAALQAISKRIHYGKFIAEAKFQQETERSLPLLGDCTLAMWNALNIRL
jgi:chorismate mutase